MLEQLLWWEDGEVLGDVDAALVKFEQFDLLFLLAGAEDDAEGGFFAGLLLVFGKPTGDKLVPDAPLLHPDWGARFVCVLQGTLKRAATDSAPVRGRRKVRYRYGRRPERDEGR